MLRSSDASSTTLCDDEVPQTAAYDPRSDSIPAQDADESTSATAAAPEDDIFDWLMEEDSDAESIKVEADQDFMQLPTASLDSTYDPDQITHEMELSGSQHVSFHSASVSRPLSSPTCVEPFPDETTEQPFFLDPFEYPVPRQPSSCLTPSPPPQQPARSYPRQMASYSPVIVQPEATVPALDALVSMFSDCPDPPHRSESSSVVNVVRRDSSPRLLDIEGVPTFGLDGSTDARSSPLIAHTALVHEGVDQVDGVLEDQKDTAEIDLVPQFSAFWEDEE
ncbi:hypothetical protein EXIGLDRAFT_11457 [Exidia glandulosa HHB12029]|uniref:Uncharacterized protein n=1 Tax=Exidia glandulosa HHB12029 TaxID=1314781 RepID=A0A165QSM2_EXIGL|nr:hypothetical protein EXIGLDRAFT_11457 [Exidia glandulosa HHB12029]